MAKIAVLIGPMFEDDEYTKPARALREAGHELEHLSTEDGTVEGKHGTTVEIDGAVAEASTDDYDALLIPGGFSPDQLRAHRAAVDFVRDFADTDKPIFAICHGPQLLMAADRVDGRRLTAWKTIQHDLEYTEAEVLDEEVVEDGNLITSRQPSDIPAFNRAITERLAET